MRLRVLGQTEAYVDDASVPIDLGSRKPRCVVTALAMRHDGDVPATALVDLVWGDEAPRASLGTLQAYISGLRRALEPGLGPRERPTVLVTTDHGYRLDLPRGAVDAHAFADEVRVVHRRLAPLAGQLGSGSQDAWPTQEVVSADVDRVEQLLAWWRGPAYADLHDHPAVVVERAALDELRRSAEEARLLGLLALGDHATVVAATEQAIARDPLRERVWALHALALTRTGRQADALASLRRVRALLADELGLDLSTELVDLELLVLRQDPALQRRLRASVAGEDPAPAARTPTPARTAWDLVGRAGEEKSLRALLDQADAGEPACGLVVGEPGIGKTRLVDLLASEAADRGYVVATGRCSQDDGAPPLWPWVSVVRAVSSDPDSAFSRLTSSVGSSEVDAFLSWDAIARAILDRAATAPVLVVLEDLHWADTATLRVLTHLLDIMGRGHRLAVVGTRRPWPAPQGALLEAGEAFARRHAARLDLMGLGREDAATLVQSVLDGPADPASVTRWHERAGGNPFFLIELARLGEAAAEDAMDSLPAGVRDVVIRRVQSLPADCRDLLQVASALGRRFALDVLAAVVDDDPDHVDLRIDAARNAGLVVDVEAGTLAFSHALTRDAVAGSLTPSRLSRLHARVAHTLESDERVAAVVRPEERVAELARHWLAAGPTHVGRAWLAAADAARQARQAFSYEEAAQLMAQAIDALRKDPSATEPQLFDLLLLRAGDCQRAANWRGVVECAFAAIDLARSTHDPVRMARAASELTRNVIWLPHEWQEVFEDVIEDLRWALRELPTRDGRERCELMLTLAVELYYAPTAVAEVDALVEEGLAVARRVGDPRLLWWAARAAWIAWWTPARLPERTALSAEALTAARESSDDEMVAVALTFTATDALERGDVESYQRDADEALRIAGRRRLAFVQYALGWVELNIAVMRGDEDATRARAAELHALRPRVAVPADELHEVGIAMSTSAWSPEKLAPFVDPMIEMLDTHGLEMGLEPLYVALARTGRVEELSERMRLRPGIHPIDNWGSALDACFIAEAAAAVADRHQAARTRDMLSPLTGRMAIAGVSMAIGPVDGYLALAEATLGDSEAAAAHADRAVGLATAWDLPVYVAWLEGKRSSLGF